MPRTDVRILFRLISKCVAGGAVAVYFSGCLTPPPPYEDYTIARTAVQAAQEVDAPRFSAGLWTKADENYRKGEKAWREAEFDDAKRFFKNAITFAERAEDATRLKKFESGDSFP